MYTRHSRVTRPSTALAVGLVVASAACAKTVPAELPRPDDTPPASDKPVRVYIISGQSNSLGFGRVEGGDPPYRSIFLSADPRVEPARMPVGDAALLPHRVYTSAEGDEAGARASVYKGSLDAGADSDRLRPIEEATVPLGDVTATLPGTDGPYTVVVDAYLEVPMTGTHEVHVGTGDSSYAVARINGQEVYRRDIDGELVITPIELESGKRHPISIVYTKGGSATFWMELTGLEAKGTLEYLTRKRGRFPAMVTEDGEWSHRDDVILNNAYLGKGKSQRLSPTNRPTFGPELGFGYVMGTFHDEPVLLLKADIGNRGLAWDILPPGSERYEVDGMIYAGYGDTQSRWPKEQGEPRPGGWYAGKQYDEYTEAIRRELAGFDQKYPQWKDQGYKIAGFVWWQGHKDQNPVHAARYEQNLVNLINAWRTEFGAPDAKFVLATIAFGGWDLDGPGKTIAEAQLAVSDYDKYPQHKGNVKTIEARDFWRGIGESPKNQDYHYNHNAETYLLVGDALGRAMVELEGGQAEPRKLPDRPETPDTWPEEPTLEQAVQMVYSDAFISPWAKDPAEPTAEDYAAMAPALRPIIVDALIPRHVSGSFNVPTYRRRGVPLASIVTRTPPTKYSAGLESQLDTIIEMYEAAGIDTYRWKPLTPDMRTATWHYLSFDPNDGWEDPGRYREIDLPTGMAGWAAVDFDPAKAGWKQAQAPFGQNNGELKPLRGTCNNPQCRCDTQPNTLWPEEVLLIRQTFEVPPLKEGHRYRLVVGGGSHPWGGEGYAVYVNGELFCEEKQAFYKNGGERGAYIFEDVRPAFASGEVTIAVKGFLRRSHHRGKPAPPTGHLSVWLEEVQLPEIVIEQAKRAQANAAKQ